MQYVKIKNRASAFTQNNKKSFISALCILFFLSTLECRSVLLILFNVWWLLFYICRLLLLILLHLCFDQEIQHSFRRCVIGPLMYNSGNTESQKILSIAGKELKYLRDSKVSGWQKSLGNFYRNISSRLEKSSFIKFPSNIFFTQYILNSNPLYSPHSAGLLKERPPLAIGANSQHDHYSTSTSSACHLDLESAVSWAG